MKVLITILVTCISLSARHVMAEANENPPILKKGEMVWYRCEIESARGQWAIENFPIALELIIGELTSKTDDLTKWKGHLSFTYRNGSVRLRAADISQSFGFINSQNPHGGFVDHGWLATDLEGDFEFRENRDSKTGWHENFELKLNGDSANYVCKIVEPVGLPH